jgi:hypothetical protein
MAGRNDGNEMVDVPEMLCVTETEKSYGVIPYATILAHVEPNSVVHLDHIKDRFQGLVQWMPKTQIQNVVLGNSDIFPNLTIKFTCKFNAQIIPYKSSIKFQMKKWLVEKKGLSEDSQPIDNGTDGTDGIDPSNGW